MKSLRNYITENCSTVDTDALYDSMLDECYSFDSVGGPFKYMCASRVLKECDPTAYRCGKVDWIDAEGFVEIEGDYYNGMEVEDAREAFVSQLEDELSDLESELEELQAEEDEDDRDESEIDRVNSEIEAKQAEITEAKGYTF